MTGIALVLNGISVGVVYAAVALALVLIWRATGIVNFAQGGMLMLTTFIAYTVVVEHGANYWVGLVVALAAGFVLGAVVERVLVRPVENGPPLNAVILTLGVLLLLQAVAGMIWGNNQESYVPEFSRKFYTANGHTLLFSPNSLFIVIAVAIVASLLTVLFRGTSLGLRMRASAFNPEIARMLGVRVGRMLTLGWALAAVVGALAGVLVASDQPEILNPNGFDGLLIFGFTAAVIGGLDSPIGALIGGLLLGIALVLLEYYVSNQIDTFWVLCLLVVVLMVRPAGLFSRRGARRV